MDSKRCFIAVTLPEPVRKSLAEIQGKIEKVLLKEKVQVKWVEPQNLHLTIKFLGDISDGQIKQIKSKLNSEIAKISGFEFILAGVGGFPNLKNPKVIWAGVKDQSQGLATLQQAVEKVALEAGIERDNRRFTPHLTLGRCKKCRFSAAGASTLEKTAKEADAFGSIVVNALELFESTLFPKGPVYKCIDKFSLNTDNIL